MDDEKPRRMEKSLDTPDIRPPPKKDIKTQNNE